MMHSNLLSSAASLDPTLARMLDELTAKIQRGEPVDLDGLLAEHPEHATELRELLPTLAALGDLSNSVDAAGSVFPYVVDGTTSGILGDFRLIREVGRGGMGVVYEAEQISLNRRVALKVLPFAATMDPRHLQRFKNEALAAASLEHPHIVPVYGVGCERGVHFYAMKYIDGRPLTEVIRPSVEAAKSAAPDAETAPVARAATVPRPRDPGRFRRIAEWGIQAAEALEHAHSLGIVHRDIKPGNLLIDGQGKLWVTDFGLAKMGADAGMTMTGDLLGTLRYMSPEQALAKHGLVDHRTDVYSLGATLYELLTGHPAVIGEDKQEVLKHIAFEEPIPLRKIDRAIPVELETITLKCLAKGPIERYASAGEVAEDLRRWLGDHAIKAKPPRWREKVVKWRRRHRAFVTTCGLLLVIVCLAVLAGAAALLWRKAETALSSERVARDGEAEALRKMEAVTYVNRIRLAHDAWEKNDLRQARVLLESCPVEHRDWEWGYLNRLFHREILVLPGHVSYPYVLSPDGQKILNADTVKMSEFPCAVRIWDIATGREMLAKDHPHRVSEVAISPDGRLVASTMEVPIKSKIDQSEYYAVHIWDAATGRDVVTLRDPMCISNIAFSPTNRFVAAIGTNTIHDNDRNAVRREKSVIIWDLSSEAKATTFRVPHCLRGSLTFTQDNRQLLFIWQVNNGDGVRLSPDSHKPQPFSIITWHTETYRETDRFTLVGSESPWGTQHRVSTDGKRLAILGPGPDVHVWDLASRSFVRTLQGHTAPLGHRAEFTADGRRFATASQDGTARLWDIASGRQTHCIRTPDGGSSLCALISADGTKLATVGANNLRVWDVDDTQSRILKLPFFAYHIAFFPDSSRLVMSYGARDKLMPREHRANGGLSIVDVASGWELRYIDQGRKWMNASIGFQPAGRLVACYGADATITIVDVSSGDVSFSDCEQGSDIREGRGLYISPCGQYLVGGGSNGAFVAEIATGRIVRTIGESFGEYPDVWLSPDGARLALSSPLRRDNRVGVFDWASGHAFMSLEGTPSAAAWSSDGRYFAIGCSTGRIEVIDMQGDWEPHQCRKEGPHVFALAFSPSGNRLASSHGDGKVRLWDWRLGEELLSLAVGSAKWGSTHGVCFSPDGRWLAASSWQSAEVALWDAAPPSTKVIDVEARKEGW